MLDLACDIRNELTNAVQTTFTKAKVVHTKIFCIRLIVCWVLTKKLDDTTSILMA